MPNKKRSEAGAADTPGVAPGLIRLRATAYYKDGVLLQGFPGCKVEEGQVIEVTPEVCQQLMASCRCWTVLNGDCEG